METDAGALWWLTVLFSSAVGTAMLVYAVRQKDPMTLFFGLALSSVPMLVSSGVLSVLLAVLILGLFWGVRKYL
ncbi:MAG: hypothetical protein KAH38_05775 [Candidatus Hydrogenedentes bacterium]|nr:hypothetical protein [Candidatus Hydrogenedentota bacterium]